MLIYHSNLKQSNISRKGENIRADMKNKYDKEFRTETIKPDFSLNGDLALHTHYCVTILCFLIWDLVNKCSPCLNFSDITSNIISITTFIIADSISRKVYRIRRFSQQRF
jgi:hypothetical protein